MNGQSCENCRYFKYLKDEEYDGFCRRYPPSVLQNHSFPDVYDSGWCGEWCPANPDTLSAGATYLARLVLLGDATAAYALVDKLTEDRQDTPNEGTK